MFTQNPRSLYPHIYTKRSYVAAEVQFLMDESDTMLSYENKGRAEPFGQHPLMLLTSSLDRVQQLEVIYGECEQCAVTRREVMM